MTGTVKLSGERYTRWKELQSERANTLKEAIKETRERVRQEYERKIEELEREELQASGLEMDPATNAARSKTAFLNIIEDIFNRQCFRIRDLTACEVDGSDIPAGNPKRSRYFKESTETLKYKCSFFHWFWWAHVGAGRWAYYLIFGAADTQLENVMTRFEGEAVDAITNLTEKEHVNAGVRLDWFNAVEYRQNCDLMKLIRDRLGVEDKTYTPAEARSFVESCDSAELLKLRKELLDDPKISEPTGTMDYVEPALMKLEAVSADHYRLKDKYNLSGFLDSHVRH